MVKVARILSLLVRHLNLTGHTLNSVPVGSVTTGELRTHSLDYF